MYTHVEVFKQNNDKIGQNNTEARSYACVGSGGGGVQWIVKTTCKSFSVCYNVCFKLTFRNEMLWNIFLKKHGFCLKLFFQVLNERGVYGELEVYIHHYWYQSVMHFRELRILDM